MKTKFLLLTILISIIFFACKKDDPKFHFTEEEKKQALYYSYNVGDTLYFKKNGNDSVKLIVKNKYLNEHKQKPLISPNYGEIHINFNNGNVYALVKQEHRDDSSYKFVQIDFFNIFGGRSTLDPILEELTIDSITYNRVYVYSSTKFPDNKIYANEKYGIIKAENDSTTYTLIP